jgi:integrase
LAAGANPRLHRQKKRLAARQAEHNTFHLVCAQWLEYRKLEIQTGTNSTHARMLHFFEKDILPFLGKRPIHEIRRADLLEVVERIERRGSLSVAQKVRGYLGQVFRYALVKIPGLETNPAADLDVVAIPQRPARHHPFLRMNELPELLQNLETLGNDQTGLALRLLLLTGVRTGELRKATREQFDFEGRLWRIPPENVKQLQRKMRKASLNPQDLPPYVVPLSRQAAEIVQERSEDSVRASVTC